MEKDKVPSVFWWEDGGNDKMQFPRGEQKNLLAQLATIAPWRNSVKHHEIYRKMQLRGFCGLDISISDARKLMRIFNVVNFSGTGEIEVNDLLEYMSITNKFAERVFSLFSPRAGSMVFLEFVRVVYAVCSLTRRDLIAFAHHLYDTNTSGHLGQEELMKMVTEIYDGAELTTHSGVQTVQAAMLVLVAKYRRGVSERIFYDFCKKNSLVMSPVLQMQTRLREKVFGEAFWVRRTRRLAKQRHARVRKKKKNKETRDRNRWASNASVSTCLTLLSTRITNWCSVAAAGVRDWKKMTRRKLAGGEWWGEEEGTEEDWEDDSDLSDVPPPVEWDPRKRLGEHEAAAALKWRSDRAVVARRRRHTHDSTGDAGDEVVEGGGKIRTARRRAARAGSLSSPTSVVGAARHRRSSLSRVESSSLLPSSDSIISRGRRRAPASIAAGSTATSTSSGTENGLDISPEYGKSHRIRNGKKKQSPTTKKILASAYVAPEVAAAAAMDELLGGKNWREPEVTLVEKFEADQDADEEDYEDGGTTSMSRRAVGNTRRGSSTGIAVRSRGRRNSLSSYSTNGEWHPGQPGQPQRTTTKEDGGWGAGGGRGRRGSVGGYESSSNGRAPVTGDAGRRTRRGSTGGGGYNSGPGVADRQRRGSVGGRGYYNSGRGPGGRQRRGSTGGTGGYNNSGPVVGDTSGRRRRRGSMGGYEKGGGRGRNREGRGRRRSLGGGGVKRDVNFLQC